MNLLYLATEDVLREQISGKVHFWALATELNDMGHAVTVIAPRFGRSPVQHKGPIRVLSFRAPGKSALGLLCFECLLLANALWIRKHIRPDAALVRGGGPGWFMGIIFLTLRILGTPVLLECNGIVWREMRYRSLPWWLVANAYFSAWQQALTCNAIIGVSKGITEAYRRLGWRSNRKCWTIPNGVDIGEFGEVSDSQRTATRKELHLPDRALLAGYVGTFSPWHDIQLMLRASQLLGEAGDRDIFLLLIGTGPLYDWACQQKAANNLRQVMLPGPITDRKSLRRWMACFDVGLCLSPYPELHGSPLKMFEYMATGVPIVASGFPQALELCDQQHVGIGLRNPTAESLVEALRSIRNDTSAWRCVGEKNRRLAIDHYSWGRVAREVVEVIERCRQRSS